MIRKILALKSTITTQAEPENRSIELASYDVLLPCRRFSVSYKVAVLGRVSLTAEFLLRLLKASDGLDEASAASFFGFDGRDMSFVVSEVQSLGYVQRREGCLWLTAAGLDLFHSGSERPEIFDVESIKDSLEFDLISTAPQRFRYLEEFEAHLPELKISDHERASSASSRIPAAFRRFYMEISSQKSRNGLGNGKRSIYSIDEVQARDRFLVPIRVRVRSNTTRPWDGTADLSGWRSEQELQDREAIGDAASAFVDALRINRHASDPDAYAVLTDIAPEFLKQFTRSTGLAIERYFNDVLERTGDVKNNRPTIPILGALTIHTNFKRMIDVLSYATRRTVRPSNFIWVKPQSPMWGATSVLPEGLKQLKEALFLPEAQQKVGAICLLTGRSDKYLEKAFDNVFVSNVPRLPNALEILIVPGLMAAVVVHATMNAHSGHAVPLGFVSFDHRVVTRTQEFIAHRISGYNLTQSFFDEIMRDLEIDNTPPADEILPPDLQQTSS